MAKEFNLITNAIALYFEKLLTQCPSIEDFVATIGHMKRSININERLSDEALSLLQLNVNLDTEKLKFLVVNSDTSSIFGTSGCPCKVHPASFYHPTRQISELAFAMYYPVQQGHILSFDSVCQSFYTFSLVILGRLLYSYCLEEVVVESPSYQLRTLSHLFLDLVWL